MTRRTTIAIVLAIVSLSLAPQAQAAQQPQNHNRIIESANGAALRSVRKVVRHTPTAMRTAWARLAAKGTFTAIWDASTHVPLRIYGSGIRATGSDASSAIAASFATKFLATHIDLLAPGSSPSDFALIANHLGDDGVRAVGFRQTHGGLQVVGGQVSFRFKNDRLFVIASEAMPSLGAVPQPSTANVAAMRTVARNWIATDFGAAHVVANKNAVILPVIPSSARHPSAIRYRVAVPVEVEAPTSSLRFTVYVERSTGKPIARRQNVLFADGTLFYNAAERHPGGDRIDYPASDVNINLDGQAVSTDATGGVTWAGAATATLTTSVVGPLVRIQNDAGALSTDTLMIDPDGTATWDLSGSAQGDAQIATFVHTNVAKQYARTFAPNLAWLNQSLRAEVNNSGLSCNALYDGEGLVFFTGDAQCANTGRLADVIYHEFGHALHHGSLVDGVGFFDSALSEGASDYLAATITNDPGMGRGFFNSDEPLRHIDPMAREFRWPQDISQDPHATGLIFAGAMWDLRKDLIATHGLAAGRLIADQLFFAALSRSVDIPSTVVEILAADDDDGDLANGTPNECAILLHFSAHGIGPDFGALGPGLLTPVQTDLEIRVPGFDPPTQCPLPQAQSVTVTWHPHGNPAGGGTVDLAPEAQPNGTDYVGMIPAGENDKSILYSVRANFNNGTSVSLPSNPADPLYQFYRGEVVELYCTDFEADPTTEGWTTGVTRGVSGNDDDWQWGSLSGERGGGDPATAFSGSSVFGNDIGLDGRNGRYEADVGNYAQSPTISTQGLTDIRLQYRRWLRVEDGTYDQARIVVNNALAWSNAIDDGGLHHTDAEWRFHDVSLGDNFANGELSVRFEIVADQGLEFGGWTLDDFCVVAAAGPCTDCGAQCGDGVVDTGEQCDDGNDVDDDDCSNACETAVDGGCGCSADSGSGGGGWLLLLGVVLFGYIRRHRRDVTA